MARRLNEHQRAAIATYQDWLRDNESSLCAGEAAHEKPNFENWVMAAEIADQESMQGYFSFVDNALRRCAASNRLYRESRQHYRQYIIDVCKRRGIELDTDHYRGLPF